MSARALSDLEAAISSGRFSSDEADRFRVSTRPVNIAALQDYTVSFGPRKRLDNRNSCKFKLYFNGSWLLHFRRICAIICQSGGQSACQVVATGSVNLPGRESRPGAGLHNEEDTT